MCDSPFAIRRLAAFGQKRPNQAFPADAGLQGGRWHASHALAPAGNELVHRKRGNDPSQSKTESFGASRADCGAKSQAHGPHPGPVLQVHFGRYPLPGSFEGRPNSHPFGGFPHETRASSFSLDVRLWFMAPGAFGAAAQREKERLKNELPPWESVSCLFGRLS